MALSPGKFITFEGGDGTGKSTQLNLLSDYFSSHQINNIKTKEPGGTPVGQELRQLLLCGDKNKFDPIAEALLYFADRRVHLVNKIWPAIHDGEWVLSDRFADSTIAYQFYGYNQRVDYATLMELYNLTVGDFKPDLTIILDLDPRVGIARSFQKAQGMIVKETRFESRDIEFHDNLRHGFLEIARKEPDRCLVFDANKSVDELHQDIIKAVSERYGIT